MKDIWHDAKDSSASTVAAAKAEGCKPSTQMIGVTL